MSEEKIKALRETRSDYTREALWHKFLLDAALGTGGFIGKVGPTPISLLGWAAEAYASVSSAVSSSTVGDSKRETYLDQFPREDEKKFQRRIDVAHYTNYVGPIHELLISYINKSEMNRDEMPDAVESWLTDVDGAGQSWDDLMRDVIRPRASLLGWAPVLFDMPDPPEQVEGEISVARARELRLAPRAIPLFPINVLDWITDKDDGDLLAVKIRTDHEVRDNLLGSSQKQEHYALWYRDRVERYIVTEQAGKTPSLEELPARTHRFGCVPLRVFRAHPTPDDRVRGVSTIGNSAVAARRLFNLESEMDDHIRGQVFAVMGVPMMDMEANIGEIVAGNGNAIKVPHDARMGVHFAAPPASVAETLEKRMEVMVREIYRTENVEHTKATGTTAASGVARAYEFEKTNRRLSGIASSFARSEQDALRLVARMFRKPETLTVSAPTDFSVEDLSAEIDGVLAALRIDLGTTAEIELRRRLLRRMLPNLPIRLQEAINAELDALATQLESDKALEREVNRAKLDGGQDGGGNGDTLNGGADPSATPNTEAA